MRPHRRRGPLEHVLVAGSAEDLPAIQTLMLLLPGSVYGQVIVEAPDDSAVRALTTPPRVTVTRIGGCTAQDQPGDLLTDAVHAWLAEWMPGVPEPDRAVTLWVGGSACHRVEATGATLERL